MDGGTISTTDNTEICVDGSPDPIDVMVSNATGTNGGWIITDDSNNILALPPAPPFDLDGAGLGTCFIWYVRYEAGFAGNVVGNNLSELTGNFDLSNSISVLRVDEGPDCVVATSDLNSVNKLNIYPNPTNDFVQVDYEGLENGNGVLVLVDFLGRTFLQEELNQANDELTIDVSEIPFGVYMIKIDSENYSTVNKLIIMK